MSAALLREAARTMRKRAEATDRGPWTTAEASEEYDDYGYGGEVRSPMLGRAGEQDDLIASVVDRSDTEHIASWHPAVALAVAYWLEHEARLIEETDKARANDPGLRPVPQKRVDRSTAVATAYLGREAS